MKRIQDLCELLHKEWFRLRDELEVATGVDLSYRTDLSKTNNKNSLGMCSKYGDNGYKSIPLALIDPSVRANGTGIVTGNNNLRHSKQR